MIATGIEAVVRPQQLRGEDWKPLFRFGADQNKIIYAVVRLGSSVNAGTSIDQSAADDNANNDYTNRADRVVNDTGNVYRCRLKCTEHTMDETPQSNPTFYAVISEHQFRDPAC